MKIHLKHLEYSSRDKVQFLEYATLSCVRCRGDGRSRKRKYLTLVYSVGRFWSDAKDDLRQWWALI